MRKLPGGPVALVMFDLDGTLVDTVPDIAVALNAALAETNLPEVLERDVRCWVGNGARVLCGRAIARAMTPSANEALTSAVLDRFLVHYAKRVCVDTHLYEGALACLDGLRQRNLSLACVTNKPELHTRKLLAALDLERYFDAIVGGDSVARRKPDRLPLVHVMEKLKRTSAETVMVGDSATDVAAARAAGVRSLCVSYGYNHGQDVRALGADHVIDSLRDVPHLLETHRS